MANTIQCGNTNGALDLVKQLAVNDAKVQMVLQPNLEMKAAPFKPAPRHPRRTDLHSHEIYAQLLELGVEDEVALKLFNEYRDIWCFS